VISIASLRQRYRDNQEPERSLRYAELFSLVLLLLVALQLLWLGGSALGTPSVMPVEPARDSLRVVSPVSSGAVSAAQSQLLQSRPLFWASRRPLVSVVEEPKQVAEASQTAPANRLKGLNLLGALGAGEQGAAIVSYKGKVMRVAVGDDIDGWTLRSVAIGEAEFVSAGQRDLRRLLPQPVVAARPEAQPAGDAVNNANDAAGTSAVADDSSENESINQKPEGSLSLGGQ
jgi:hypothetical protein